MDSIKVTQADLRNALRVQACVRLLTNDPGEAMARRKRQFFVAVVDDDAGMREATADLLKANGFRTRGFSSAEQFLQSQEGPKAGCLVLDLRLPGMSGFELQCELRAQGLSIPVLFVTAEDDPDGQLRTKLSQAGAIAVLGKPFNPEELVSLVRSAFDAQRIS